MVSEKNATDFTVTEWIEPTSPRAVVFIPLLTTWMQAEKIGGLPSRDMFPIEEFGRLLGSVSIVDELEGTEDFRYRLFGTSIANVSGVDMTGLLASQHPDPALRGIILDGNITCLEQRQAMVQHLCYSWGGIPRDIIRLHLPVWAKDKTHRQVITVTDHQGPETRRYRPDFNSANN